VLETLNDKFRYSRDSADRVVSAKDFNMYQDFCLAIMGIQGDKGLSTLDRYKAFDTLLSDMPVKIAMMKQPASSPVEVSR
jgi:hypothetical protein